MIDFECRECRNWIRGYCDFSFMLLLIKIPGSFRNTLPNTSRSRFGPSHRISYYRNKRIPFKQPITLINPKDVNSYDCNKKNKHAQDYRTRGQQFSF